MLNVSLDRIFTRKPLRQSSHQLISFMLCLRHSLTSTRFAFATKKLSTPVSKENQPGNSRVNIFIAAFTSCHILLKLYSYLEQSQEHVVYFGTDFVFSCKKRTPYFLGDITVSNTITRRWILHRLRGQRIMATKQIRVKCVAKYVVSPLMSGDRQQLKNTSFVRIFSTN